jgi:sec-independent protein translocase protein TatA
MPSGYEWLIVLAVIALLFGGAKLPKLAKSLGEAQREFKKGTDEGEASATAASTPSTPASPVESDKPTGSGPVV